VALGVDLQSVWQRDYLLIDRHGVSPASARGYAKLDSALA